MRRQSSMIIKNGSLPFRVGKDDRRRSGNGLAPIQVFNAVLSPPFSAPRYSPPRPETLSFFGAPLGYKRGRGDEIHWKILKERLRNLFLHFTVVRREAQTSAAPGLAGFPQGRFEKAKPSTVAAAVPGPSPSFLATLNGREPKNKILSHEGRGQVRVGLMPPPSPAGKDREA